MTTRRQFLAGGAALIGAAMADKASAAPDVVSRSDPATEPPRWLQGGKPYQPVVTLNGWTLPSRMKDGVKEFHLVAEPVKREFAPGMTVNCWGYNGSTPGPTIERGARLSFHGNVIFEVGNTTTCPTAAWPRDSSGPTASGRTGATCRCW